MKIEAKMSGIYEHINITGGRLRTKFSVIKKSDGYYATAAKGSQELIQFLDQRHELSDKDDFDRIYYKWKIDSDAVISVINSVIREYE